MPSCRALARIGCIEPYLPRVKSIADLDAAHQYRAAQDQLLRSARGVRARFIVDAAENGHHVRDQGPVLRNEYVESTHEHEHLDMRRSFSAHQCIPQVQLEAAHHADRVGTAKYRLAPAPTAAAEYGEYRGVIRGTC